MKWLNDEKTNISDDVPGYDARLERTLFMPPMEGYDVDKMQLPEAIFCSLFYMNANAIPKDGLKQLAFTSFNSNLSALLKKRFDDPLSHLRKANQFNYTENKNDDGVPINIAAFIIDYNSDPESTKKLICIIKELFSDPEINSLGFFNDELKNQLILNLELNKSPVYVKDKLSHYLKEGKMNEAINLAKISVQYEDCDDVVLFLAKNLLEMNADYAEQAIAFDLLQDIPKESKFFISAHGMLLDYILTLLSHYDSVSQKGQLSDEEKRYYQEQLFVIAYRMKDISLATRYFNDLCGEGMSSTFDINDFIGKVEPESLLPISRTMSAKNKEIECLRNNLEENKNTMTKFKAKEAAENRAAESRKATTGFFQPSLPAEESSQPTRPNLAP